MALESYRLLSPMNADQRYDMGRIAEVAGAIPLAAAQADTILQQNPTHLLGLILAAQVAALEKQPAKQAAFTKRLLAALKSETAKKLPEYDRHSGRHNRRPCRMQNRQVRADNLMVSAGRT